MNHECPGDSSCPICQPILGSLIHRCKTHDQRVGSALQQIAIAQMTHLAKVAEAEFVAIVVAKPGMLEPIVIAQLYSAVNAEFGDKAYDAVANLVHALYPHHTLGRRTSVETSPPAAGPFMGPHPPNDPHGS